VTEPDHQCITLRDGRTLAYAEYGDPKGEPVIYCHGTPSSRAEAELTIRHTLTADTGLRVIIPDRPGMGLSDFQPDRRIVDWPGDVLDLLNALKLEKSAVLGSSGGAPFALACGALIADRVTVIGVIGGVAEGSTVIGRLARVVPPVMCGLIRLQLLALRSASVRKSIANAFPEPDRSLFQNEKIREGFIGCLEECCRRGTRGAAQEIGMLSEPWGFDPRRVTVPVFLWQGARDGTVSADGARYLASALPNCHAKFYPDDAHLSVLMNHHQEIFSALRLPSGARCQDLIA